MNRILIYLCLTIALLTSCATSEAAIDKDIFRTTPSPLPYTTVTDTSAAPAPTPSPTPTPRPMPAPDELEEYTGPLHHVFYHFLIAFPEIAKTNSYGINLDNDTVTPTEFWRSLEELYKNGFVLIDINRYIDYGEDGKVKLAKIMVPKGKKPLIMSFDDINYYSKNQGNGICDKIILDEDGNLAMLTYQPDGTALITYDNCVVPLLEKFIEQYPDFSPFGDKGLLAITGFDGILGYRTQRDSPNREAEIKAVAPVVEALKSRGWQFASHSYGHIRSKSVGLDRVKSDTKNWENEVASIVGDTKIYVFPYGEYTKHDQAEFKHLIDSGFVFFCGVGMPPYLKVHDGYIFMDRQNIDGFSLRNHAKWLAPLMDNTYVFCHKERPRPFEY